MVTTTKPAATVTRNMLRKVGSEVSDSAKGNASVAWFFTKSVSVNAANTGFNFVKKAAPVVLLWGAWIASYKVVPYLDHSIIPHLNLGKSLTETLTPPILTNFVDLAISHGRQMRPHVIEAIRRQEDADYLLIGAGTMLPAGVLLGWYSHKIKTWFKNRKKK